MRSGKRRKLFDTLPYAMGRTDVDIISFSNTITKLMQFLSKETLIKKSEDGRKSAAVRIFRINLFCLERDYQWQCLRTFTGRKTKCQKIKLSGARHDVSVI